MLFISRQTYRRQMNLLEKQYFFEVPNSIRDRVHRLKHKTQTGKKGILQEGGSLPTANWLLIFIHFSRKQVRSHVEEWSFDLSSDDEKLLANLNNVRKLKNIFIIYEKQKKNYINVMMKKKNRKKGSTTKEIIFIILKETDAYTRTQTRQHGSYT